MMKRFISAVIVCVFCWPVAKAQTSELGLFNHLAVGASVGTEGWGVDLAVPVTQWAAIRAGISKYPEIMKYSTTVSLEDVEAEGVLTTEEITLEGKINTDINYKVLVDLYPFKNSSFHLTAGAFYGPRNFASAYNTEPFLAEKDWGTAGVTIGDYRITTDENGIIQANVEFEQLKPYLGLGFGRAVPNKRVNVTCDFGVKLWGTPGIYMWTKDEWGDNVYQELTKEGLGDDQFNDAFDIMSKVTVYPVLSIRISGKIF